MEGFIKVRGLSDRPCTYPFGGKRTKPTPFPLPPSPRRYKSFILIDLRGDGDCLVVGLRPTALNNRPPWHSVKPRGMCFLFMICGCRGCSLHSCNRNCSCLCLVFCVCGSAGRPGRRQCRRLRGSGYLRDSLFIFLSGERGFTPVTGFNLFRRRSLHFGRDDTGRGCATVMGFCLLRARSRLCSG